MIVDLSTQETDAILTRGLCFFCRSHQTDKAIKTGLYLETERKNYGSSKEVGFRAIDIEIPVCSSCVEVHNLAKKKGDGISWKVMLALAGVGAVLGYFLSNSNKIAAAIFSALGCFALGVFIGDYVRNQVSDSICEKNGVFPRNHLYFDNHPMLEEAVGQGWSTYKPRA